MAPPPGDEVLAGVVAARIAEVLYGAAPDPLPPRCVDAAAATVALVRGYLYDDPLPGFDPDPLPLATDRPDFVYGLVALGVRVYHDPASPGGVLGADAYTSGGIPEDLFTHVQHYFARDKRSWGIA